MTNRQWLTNLANTDVCTEQDETKMKVLLHSFGLRVQVTCGMVYYEPGYGFPMSIHEVAKEIIGK